MREPGKEFLEMAKHAVCVVGLGDYRIEEELVRGTRFCRLTDLGLLDRPIPVDVPGTLYHHFSTTLELDTVAMVIVDEVDEATIVRARHEAAEGMMDNRNCVYR